MRKSWKSALVAALACAGTARAGAPPAPDGTAPRLPLEGEVINPAWAAQPNGDAFAREYPPVAALMKVEGSATMTCDVETDGRLDFCRIVRETPAGYGFGAAVLRLSAYFMMKPATVDGTPIKGRVTIPIAFRLGGEAKDAPEDAPEPPPTSAGALQLARQVVARQDLAGQMRAAWRPAFERVTAEIVVNGQGAPGEAALDAMRQGLDDVIRSHADRMARRMAAHMSEADLRATLAFLDTPAGEAWTASELQIALVQPPGFGAQLARAARTHLCGAPDCTPKSAAGS